MILKQDYTTKADGYKNPALVPKGIMVHSTALPGVMAQTFRNSWNRPNVGASIHAFVDNKEIIQCLPWTTQAGHCAGSANRTHIAFEICEPAGFKYSGGSTMVGYDVKAQEPYFRAMWKNAVELCSYLCQKFNLNPMTDILCHSEGYKKGIASNHGDVMHWFPKHGENMDTFRAAVKAQIEAEKKAAQKPKEEDEDMTLDTFKGLMKQYRAELQDNDAASYSKEARDWAVKNGIIQGTSSKEFNGSWEDLLSREALVTMLYRFAKLIGKA